MGYWQTRGLRGSDLEDMINRANKEYFNDDLAVVQKVPTAIKPVKLDNDKKRITLAYFDEKSTVDYIGNIQGIPVCFDAKEISKKSLPLSNIHLHQIQFMDKFESQGGLSFLLVYFREKDEYYILEFETLLKYWNEAEVGGRKSIPYDAFKKELEVFIHPKYSLHYLEGVGKYLQIKEEN